MSDSPAGEVSVSESPVEVEEDRNDGAPHEERPSSRRTLVAAWRASPILRVVTFGILAGLVVVVLASSLTMCGNPAVLATVHATSVTILPSQDVDLVERAGRSAAPGDELAEGIGFNDVRILRSPTGTDTVRIPTPPDLPTAAIRPTANGAAQEEARSVSRARWTHVLRSLGLTRGCQVELQRYGTGRLWMAVSELPNPQDEDGRCGLVAELLHRPSAADPTRDDAQTPLQLIRLEEESVGSAGVLLELWRTKTFRIPRIPVAQVRFETERGEAPLESSVLGGSLRITYPPVGRRHELLVWDTVSLGELGGELVELTVGDTIEVVYKGEASDPRVGPGRASLRPSLLEQVAQNGDLRLGLAVALSVITLGLGLADLFIELE